MTSLKEKWNYKVEMTLGEMYNPSWELPHKGIVEIARELETIIGKEKTLKLLTKIAEKFMIEQAKEATKDNPIESFSDFLELFKKTSEESFWDKINVDEYVRITENTREVKTVECVAADVWRNWGAEDIGYAYNCVADFAFIQALHPKMKLERTKTLMQGHDCCDFKFIWDNE
jgi:predicted ArsR family transcriptional regulator